MLHTVISVLPVFEECVYFPSSANKHCVQPDYKPFPQNLGFYAFLSGYSCLVVVKKFFCHKVTGVKCLSSAPNTWKHCRSCFSAVIQLDSALEQILIAIKVCRGSFPQEFFVLHLAAASNHSLKGATLAITLHSCLYACTRNCKMTFDDAISDKL